MPPNQDLEQTTRNRIDGLLAASGWSVQNKKEIHFSAGPGLAVREFPTDTGSDGYFLFVDQQAVGVIEAKKETLGHNSHDPFQRTRSGSRRRTHCHSPRPPSHGMGNSGIVENEAA